MARYCNACCVYVVAHAVSPYSCWRLRYDGSRCPARKMPTTRDCQEMAWCRMNMRCPTHPSKADRLDPLAARQWQVKMRKPGTMGLVKYVAVESCLGIGEMCGCGITGALFITY